MGKLSPDEKKKMGQAVNTFKQSVAEAISKRVRSFISLQLKESLK